MEISRKNKTHYLVTGAAGFIGSHLVEALLARGHKVLGIDDLSTGRMDNIRHLLSCGRFSFARSSILDPVVLDRLASKASIIVHLAAAVGVRLVVEQPARTIETNVLGTEAVLKAALRYGCRILIASSSEVYGKGNRIPFQEDDDVLLGPTYKARWGYAASKMLDEFMGFAYMREHGLEVVPVRLFNTVGPRQTGKYGMVIPNFVHQALHSEPLTVFGDGSQSRCFCYVGDVVEAMIRLSSHPDSPGRVYNIGSTDEISILSLAEKIIKATGSHSPIHLIPYDEAYSPGFEDMKRRVPDISRIHELVGWEPLVGIDEVIERVVTSYCR